MNAKIRFFRWISIGLIYIIGLGCANTELYQSDATFTDTGEPVYSVFLIGDTGYSSHDPREPILSVLEQQLMQYGEQSAIIFLGDNVYPDGLPPKENASRLQPEKRLLAQLQTVENYPGRIFFIPGNHDWHSSGEKGLEFIRRQEQFVESYLERGNTFLPDSGSPGPVSVSLSQDAKENVVPYDIQLIVLDTQWWLHPYEKPFSPGINNEERQKKKVLSDMEKMIDNHKDDEILVAAHHPLFSYGRHGGKFPASTHLLPPVVGSMYVAYRNIWGYPQDIANYKDLKDGLLEVFERKNDIIYASGHEHSLQFIPRKERGNHQYYVVSGSGSVTSYVKKQRDKKVTLKAKGFVTIHFYSDRTKKIQFWSEQGDIIFEKIIASNQ